MGYLDILRRQLPIDEGTRTRPYRDSVGKLTIGVGRNLDDVGLSLGEIAYLLENDIAQAEKSARVLVPKFDTLTEERKAVLVNMAFNLGHYRLSMFVKFLAAVREARWADAADQMLDSTWATQVGDRAIRLANEMRG